MLAELNHERFQAFRTDNKSNSAKQAALTFAGDVYRGLDAASMKPDDLVYGQDHLRILSGLYGLLRPLDAIQSYKGPLLVLYGDLDDVVLPGTSEAVISAATSSIEVVRHVVKGAGHGLGLFNDKPALTEEAVATTVDFFSQRL